MQHSPQPIPASPAVFSEDVDGAIEAAGSGPFFYIPKS